MNHIPVLLEEVLEYLNPKPNKNFVDCTFGSGGHAAAILEKTKPDGKLLGIDLDINLFKTKAAEIKYQISPPTADPLKAEKINNRLILVQNNFANLKKIVKENNFKSVNGVLLDLGFSSWQMEKSGRGFSFRKNEPLKMSYKLQITNYELTAEYVVNVWLEKELVKIFQEYGEERFSRRIAKKICEERKIKAIRTTFQLVEIIRRAIPSRFRHQRIHCATRVFQALRIIVNDELNNLKKVLPQAVEVLEPNGKIAVISFHSLEDRIVKHFFKEQSKLGKLKIITKKPIIPTSKEVEKNSRSRSAKLRVAMKIQN